MTLEQCKIGLDVAGALASIAGLVYAIKAWQAAIAAKLAAIAAANQVRGIQAVVDLSALRMICRDIGRHFDNGAFRDARHSVEEAISQVNQLRNHPNTKPHLRPEEWRDVTASLGGLEDALRELENGISPNGVNIRLVIRTKVEERLETVASRCQVAAEGII